MKERFEKKRFKDASLLVIEQSNAIIQEYMDRGFKLTLRQLYYQHVARGLLPNKQSEYKRLGHIINDARLAGLVDWAAIEDRTRELITPLAWSSPESIVASIADQYQEDLWASQDYRPEVWVEKEALIGVFEGICESLRVPYFACRGYTSQTLVYDAGKRFQRYLQHRQAPIILHFGDHDPSGIDMTRDNQMRIMTFARSMGVEVRRLALNMDQIEEYGPPPNPAKETDARFGSYLRDYGEDSWELDALDPTVLADLVDGAVSALRNDKVWEVASEKEQTNKRQLDEVSERWSEVVDFLEREPDNE